MESPKFTLAIVGTSHLSYWESKKVEEHIASLVSALKKITEQTGGKLVVLTGGAKGVDSIAEKVSLRLGVECLVYFPFYQEWQYFKVRNLEIAIDCNSLMCITARANGSEYCYHCNTMHRRSGGCWTLKQVENKRKELHVLDYSDTANAVWDMLTTYPLMRYKIPIESL